MERTKDKRYKYGLVGRNISYSFSKEYFSKKFLDSQLEKHSYENFDLQKVEEFKTLISKNRDIQGLNITIPYKESIIPFLDGIHPKAEQIGAVNTIKFTKQGLIGYNTDVYGFKKSIEPLLEKNHAKALILGTGGVSKAVAFVLDELEIPFTFVSRTVGKNKINYSEINKNTLEMYSIIVNCTPLGTFPDIENKPNIPYEFLEPRHLLFDLIYNPEKTAFLKEGETRGTTIFNGLKMLQLQAEKAWEIWNLQHIAH